MQEQIATTTMQFLKAYVSADTSGKYIVGLPIRSGMGAINLKFWVLNL